MQSFSRKDFHLFTFFIFDYFPSNFSLVRASKWISQKKKEIIYTFFCHIIKIKRALINPYYYLNKRTHEPHLGATRYCCWWWWLRETERAKRRQEKKIGEKKYTLNNSSSGGCSMSNKEKRIHFASLYVASRSHENNAMPSFRPVK